MEIVKKAVIKQGITGSDPRWVANLMRNLIPFDSQGAMRARRMSGINAYEGDLGRLTWDEKIFPIYMVWSYDTPIGWVDKYGAIVVPNVKYSTTTTHHQGLVQVHMGKNPCRHAPGLPSDIEDGYNVAQCGAWDAAGGDWL